MLQYVPLQPEAACLLHSISSFACLISRAHRLRDNKEPSKVHTGLEKRAGLAQKGGRPPSFANL